MVFDAIILLTLIGIGYVLGRYFVIEARVLHYLPRAIETPERRPDRAHRCAACA